MLDSSEPIQDSRPFFNRDFIKSNGIKSVSGRVSTKAEMKAIEESGRINYFLFDKEGKLNKHRITVYKGRGDVDTSLVFYLYDEKDRLATKRIKDAGGYYSYNYQYDSLGRKQKEMYCRDINAASNIDEFKLGKQFEITSETYEYKKFNPFQTKKFFYNNYDKLYKEQIIQKDSNNYLKAIYTKFIIGGNRFEFKFTYNEKGWLKKRSESSNIKGQKDKSYTYEYDEVGNLLEENTYIDNKHKTVRQFLYHEDSMLAKAQLLKDVPTNLITIIRYKYSFYE